MVGYYEKHEGGLTIDAFDKYLARPHFKFSTPLRDEIDHQGKVTRISRAKVLAASAIPGARVPLDDADVIEIRDLHAAGKFNQADLAYIFGVTQRTITDIVNHKTWRHVA